MFGIVNRLQNLGNVMTQYGTHMALALCVLIAGLLIIRWIDKGLRRITPNTPVFSILCNIVYIVLVMIVVSASAVEFGAKPVNVFRLLSIISLAAHRSDDFFTAVSPIHALQGRQHRQGSRPDGQSGSDNLPEYAVADLRR